MMKLWDDNAFECDACKKRYTYSDQVGPQVPPGWRYMIIGPDFYHYHAPSSWTALLHFCSRACWYNWILSEAATIDGQRESITWPDDRGET